MQVPYSATYVLYVPMDMMLFALKIIYLCECLCVYFVCCGWESFENAFRWEILICGCDNVSKRHARFMAQLYLWRCLTSWQFRDLMNFIRIFRTYSKTQTLSKIPCWQWKKKVSNIKIRLVQILRFRIRVPLIYLYISFENRTRMQMHTHEMRF